MKELPKYLKINEIAEITTLEPHTIRKVIRDGVLKAFKPEGTEKWLIKREDFESWFYPKTNEEKKSDLE